MLHFFFLCIFCLAVGAILGAMLRNEMWAAMRLGLWIASAMIGIAMVIAWVMYFLPL